ncbi:MAG: FKBP-type peptidyl-prolyl cis-trans isomerase [Pseudomonadota bacterium]
MLNTVRRAWLIAAAALMPFAATAAEPSTDEEKTLYAIGLAMSQNLASYNLSEAQLEQVTAGLKAGALGQDPAVDLQEQMPKIQAFARSRAAEAAGVEKRESAKFLAKMAEREGAQTMESGLIYIETKAGTGPNPAATDQVTVHYHGTLRDGSVFDSSVDRGEPATFGLNRVIPCWTEGVQKIKVGGRATLVCPSEIAYGDRGAGQKIKPGAALAFDVELIAVGE